MHNNSIKNIFTQFDNSINWNGFLYIVQKLLTTLSSLLLYYKLSASEFSAWANINSIIFLTLLWMDFGFRKSIPKFVPAFSKNKESHLFFTKFIIKWQLSSLVIISILLLLNIKLIKALIGIHLSSEIIIFAIGIFLIEASIALLKLIYHAHFWNKHFNVIYSTIILAETFLLIFALPKISLYSLYNILFVKFIFGTIILSACTIFLIKLYKKTEYPEDSFKIDQNQAKKDFIKHSGAMWYNSTLRSLMERNFILPLVTFFLGIELSNMFKVANDWAMLFQKAIVKTIGTSDTSLFSYVSEIDKNHMHIALRKIISKILRLCIPIFGLLVILILNKEYFLGNNQRIFNIFLILIVFYIFESILSPYERLLEVNKKYLVLSLSYLPSLLFIFLLIKYRIINLLGLEFFILAVSSIRLLTNLIIYVYAIKAYNLKLKLKLFKFF